MRESDLTALNERIQEASTFVEEILEEIRKVIIGQKYMIERMIIGLLCNGHILLEGVPGLAKTTAVQALSNTIAVSFKRLQFTPDLLPADLIGTQIYNQRSGDFYVKKGPIFANLVLADEINRAPAKVQSALLEAMQERQVTIGDETYPARPTIPRPSNPKPNRARGNLSPARSAGRPVHAQIAGDLSLTDRRAFHLTTYSHAKNLNRFNRSYPPKKLSNSEQLSAKSIWTRRSKTISSISSAPHVSQRRYQLDQLTDLIEYGASPRATIFLATAAKAHAFLRHRGYVTPEDVYAVGMDVLRHRVIVSYEAEAEEISSEQIIKQVFEGVEVP